MNTIKKTLLASCGVAMAMALYACGDDDSEFLSNRDDIESESSSSAGKGADAKGSSSSVETIVDVKDGPISETDSIDLSEYGQGSAVVDKDGGKVYTLMTSGVDVWTLENLDSKATHPTSTCYDYADSLCKGYGRLYLEVDDAAALCPDGYEVPRAADYRLLLESKDNYKPVYAGSCVKGRNDMLTCTGINDTAFYMTRDDSIVVVPKEGQWVVKRDDGRFGSVRCMKQKSITEKKGDLPACSKINDGRIVYVIESDSAFDCIAGGWESTRNYTVCEDGEKYLYKGRSDSLYTCSKGMWTLAGLEDIGRPCLSGNRHEDVTMNGTRYACSDSGWVALQYPASVLGECYSGVFGTIAKADSITTFVCRNTAKWQRATVLDVYGFCLKSMSGTIVKLDTIQYFCNTKSGQHVENIFYMWESDKDGVNHEHGFCTNDRVDELVVYDDRYAVCQSSNRWAFYNNTSLLPRCDSTRWDTTAFVGHKEYLCNHLAQSWQEIEHRLFEERADSVSCTIEEYGKIYTDRDQKYICKLDAQKLYTFKKASEAELKYGLCERDTAYVITEDTATYICMDGGWMKRELDEYEKKLGLCMLDTLYKVIRDNKLYTCDDGYWSGRALNKYEKIYGICADDTTYSIAEDTVIYTCKRGSWSEYVLKENERRFGLCTSDSSFVRVTEDSVFTCYHASWSKRKLYPVDLEYKVCTRDEDFVYFTDDLTYECSLGNISVGESYNSHYSRLFGECDRKAHGKDTVYLGKRFICDTLARKSSWILFTQADSLAGTYCSKEIEGMEVTLRNGVHKRCVDSGYPYYSWVTQSQVNYMPPCNEENEGLVEPNGLTNSVCHNSKWVPADTFHVTDERDGRVYAAITILGKTWMAENLAYLPTVGYAYTANSPYPVETIGDNDTVYYSWSTAMGLDKEYDRQYTDSLFDSQTVRGICMEGWHLPSYTEMYYFDLDVRTYYANYSDFYEDDDVIGLNLYMQRTLTVGRDSSLAYDTVSAVSDRTKLATFWQSTPVSYNKLNAYPVVFNKKNSLQFKDYVVKRTLNAVRCIKDD